MGCVVVMVGELVVLDFVCVVCSGVILGGGGNGEILILFLLLVVVVVVVDVYFKFLVGCVGIVVGFMFELFVLLLLMVVRGVCSVVRVGNGDFVCIDGFFVIGGFVIGFFIGLIGFGFGVFFVMD